MQINYHSTQTKFKNYKTLKKKKNLYRLVLLEIGRYMTGTVGI